MNKLQRPPLKPIFRTLRPPAGAVYRVARATSGPRLLGDLTRRPWSAAQVAEINRFHPESSDHRPITHARLLHSGTSIFADFSVQDRYVRAVNTEYQSLVSRDSCVELFLQPPGTDAYFNFELNCCGVMLLYLVEDPRKHRTRIFQKATPVPAAVADRLSVKSSLRGPIESEIVHPTSWRLGFEIPIDVISAFFPKLKRFSGSWRGNFFKCGDETSHPHWSAWADIGRRLRFHQPAKFGSIVFE